MNLDDPLKYNLIRSLGHPSYILELLIRQKDGICVL